MSHNVYNFRKKGRPVSILTTGHQFSRNISGEDSYVVVSTLDGSYIAISITGEVVVLKRNQQVYAPLNYYAFGQYLEAVYKMQSYLSVAEYSLTEFKAKRELTEGMNIKLKNPKWV